MTGAASSHPRRPASESGAAPSSPSESPKTTGGHPRTTSHESQFLARCREARRVAEELFRQKPEWVIFFREVLGVGGVVPRLFPSHEERAAFEKTPEYADLQGMLAALRGHQGGAQELEDKEPTRVITVRLPKSVHEALRAEAYTRQISMNKLCIAKLIQALEESEREETEPPTE